MMSALFRKEATVAETKTKYSEAAVALLKANLGYFGTQIPADLKAYLIQLLEYAHDDFTRMGIALNPGTLSDDMDQVTHAAWMYRKGVNGEGKTEMLKAIIRNRQVSKAISEGVAQ